MPNTLAHIAAQAVPLHVAFKQDDIKWVYIGVIVPDLPWILRRLLSASAVDIDTYALLLYAGVQSSLLFSAVLCIGLCQIAKNRRRTFALLLTAAFVHLLLDAVQTKWGNGAVLFAPVSWNTLNIGWFWPEDSPSLILTALGLGYICFICIRPCTRARDLVVPGGLRLVTLLASLALYTISPCFFCAAFENAGAYDVNVMRQATDRPGRTIQLDRKTIEVVDGTPTVILDSRERLRLDNVPEVISRVASLKGTYLDERTLRVESIHWHHPWLRDLSAVLGLVLIATYWVKLLVKSCHRGPPVRHPLSQ